MRFASALPCVPSFQFQAPGHVPRVSVRPHVPPLIFRAVVALGRMTQPKKRGTTSSVFRLELDGDKVVERPPRPRRAHSWTARKAQDRRSTSGDPVRRSHSTARRDLLRKRSRVPTWPLTAPVRPALSSPRHIQVPTKCRREHAVSVGRIGLISRSLHFERTFGACVPLAAESKRNPNRLQCLPSGPGRVQSDVVVEAGSSASRPRRRSRFQGPSDKRVRLTDAPLLSGGRWVT
jgi:hypothetical protein